MIIGKPYLVALNAMRCRIVVIVCQLYNVWKVPSLVLSMEFLAHLGLMRKIIVLMSRFVMNMSTVVLVLKMWIVHGVHQIMLALPYPLLLPRTVGGLCLSLLALRTSSQVTTQNYNIMSSELIFF